MASSIAWLFDDEIQPRWAKSFEERINNKLGAIMATLSEILDGFRAWGTSWKDKATAETARADALQLALVDAQAAAQATADALAQFQADDAVTDAAQIAAQAQADADTAQAALDAVLAADVLPEPPADPPADEVTP